MQVTITTDPVRLDDGGRHPEDILIRDASEDIVIGHENLTIATDPETDGWPYKSSDEPMRLTVPTTGLWARSVSGTATLEVFR